MCTASTDMLGSETLESDPAYESAAETYYAACMNTGQIEERGAKPLLELISTVGDFPVMNNTWKESDFNIEDIVIKLYELGLMPFMTLYVDPFKRGPKKMFSIDFPYHLLTARNDSNHQEFMMKALQLLGADETVLGTDFEAMKDFKDAIVKALYNQSASVAYPLSIDKLQEKYNWLDWLKVLKAIGAKGNVVIESTDTVFLERDWYLDQLADILNSTSKRAMANYMMSCLLTFSDLLDNRFRELTEKYPTNGLKIPTNERWKICVKATEEKLPEAVGRMYVNKYLRKKDKDFVTDMIKDIKTTFHEILEKNAWLSNETKARAQTKIFQPGYKSLGFFDLSMLMVKNKALENLNILAGDVENEKWLTSTSVVNAHYHPRSNSMYILAGIFEEPAYYPDGTSCIVKLAAV
ncbi:endothelin-converting enzyme 1-like [Physella acuta]|uniref:endothelin-converting enzyme 1-like n=1 Tax=Physella acuta TaxID=109671 RepID=UPI0027DCAEDE|nr:endothelin-converting enzyme 1-like [Physella acuta]